MTVTSPMAGSDAVPSAVDSETYSTGTGRRYGVLSMKCTISPIQQRRKNSWVNHLQLNGPAAGEGFKGQGQGKGCQRN